VRFRTQPYTCSYLPLETASLEYRIVADIEAQEYGELLRRGWRRFGCDFFRPACPRCVKCRSLRVDVERFAASKSQRRNVRRNAGLRVIVQPPTVTAEHVRLYNAFHQDMQQRRGWPRQALSERGYWETFVSGGDGFGREFLYLEGERLVGVALADVVADAISSVYFFHDPGLRARGLGVFSVLRELQFAREEGLRWQYLGYWISECQSMAYKAQYRPHEILARYPGDDEEPDWRPAG
jgi:arginine-tRNA-protein transferase